MSRSTVVSLVDGVRMFPSAQTQRRLELLRRRFG